MKLKYFYYLVVAAMVVLTAACGSDKKSATRVGTNQNIVGQQQTPFVDQNGNILNNCGTLAGAECQLGSGCLNGAVPQIDPFTNQLVCSGSQFGGQYPGQYPGGTQFPGGGYGGYSCESYGLMTDYYYNTGLCIDPYTGQYVF